jgi:pilus assembly protein Flp/PilA
VLFQAAGSTDSMHCSTSILLLQGPEDRSGLYRAPCCDWEAHPAVDEAAVRTWYIRATKQRVGRAAREISRWYDICKTTVAFQSEQQVHLEALTTQFPTPEQKELPMFDKIRIRLVDLLRKEDGPTAVEYAVMLALIIVVCLVAIQILGQNSNSAFGTVGASIGAAVGS